MRIERDQVRTLVLAAVLLAGFIGAMWLPQQFKERRLRQRIDAAKAQIAGDEIFTITLGELSRQVSQLKQTLHDSDRYIPAAGEQADLLRQFSSELQKQQASEQEIQTQAVMEGSDFNVMPVVLGFRGSCPAVFDFVRKVETGRRLVRVTSLQLHTDPAKPSDPLKAQIELSTFFTTAEAKSR